MQEFNKKTKIIISAIIIIGGILIIYTINKEQNYELDENAIVETKAEESKETEVEKEKIIIHISGAVKKEGIVELEENSRISDAIEKAEGIKENADLQKINLAYKLEDGMKIYIPEKGEKNDENEISENIKITEKEDKYIIQSNNNTENNNKKETTKVNINTANQSELESLPGIGASTAIKIIEYRKENGKFSKIEDIKGVKGIGNAKYEKIKNLIYIK